MRGERICIAGIDPEEAEHVRPTTPADDPITRELLQVHGGPLAIGAEVELSDVEPDGAAPEVEDHRFQTVERSMSATSVTMSSSVCSRRWPPPIYTPRSVPI
jgi:hypothetical protein